MKLHLIYARASNGVIGANNTLPWHLPEDLAHFKRHTLGCAVIMGRKTWDSLPAKFKPLPGRTNVVITRQVGWLAAGALTAHSLQEALALCADQAQAWVIGGADIYAQSLALADSAEITEIDAAFEGDAYAPLLGPHCQETAREHHVSSTGLGFSFVSYKNTQARASS